MVAEWVWRVSVLAILISIEMKLAFIVRATRKRAGNV